MGVQKGSRTWPLCPEALGFKWRTGSCAWVRKTNSTVAETGEGLPSQSWGPLDSSKARSIDPCSSGPSAGSGLPWGSPDHWMKSQGQVHSHVFCGCFRNERSRPGSHGSHGQKYLPPGSLQRLPAPIPNEHACTPSSPHTRLLSSLSGSSVTCTEVPTSRNDMHVSLRKDLLPGVLAGAPRSRIPRTWDPTAGASLCLAPFTQLVTDHVLLLPVQEDGSVMDALDSVHDTFTC